MMSHLLPSRKLAGVATLVAVMFLSAALAYAADALVIDQDGVKIEPNLEVGSEGSEKGVRLQGLNGRNWFRDSENKGALRVGAANGVPGIYAEEGEIIVGSKEKSIWLAGKVRADAFTGKGAVPPGAILMWSGFPQQVPAGWALCQGQTLPDGQNVPDLRGRFIVGYSDDQKSEYMIGNTGGAATVTLTVEQMPSHAHTTRVSNAGTHQHDIQLGTITGSKANNGGRSSGKMQTDPAGDHQHDVTINPTGGGQPHENRPPYYVLAYIMYTGK